MTIVNTQSSKSLLPVNKCGKSVVLAAFKEHFVPNQVSYKGSQGLFSDTYIYGTVGFIALRDFCF